MSHLRASGTNLAFVLAFICPIWGASTAIAQSTAFTYQGKLENNGTPATGLYDLRFRVLDALTNGTQVGTTLCADNVPVTNGLFSVELDFGQVYTTSPRYMEIAVRLDTGLTCLNASGFTVLSPRQHITAAPLAAHATAAFSLDAPDGSPVSALYVDNTGNIGIGTTVPLGPLDVRSGGGSFLRMGTTNGDLHFNGGTDGFFGLYNDGAAAGRTEFLWNTTVNLSIANNGGWVGLGTPPVAGTKLSVAGAGTFTGNVGIGTTAPAAALDVRGNVKLGPTGQYFAPAAEENLRIVRGVVDANGNRIVGAGFTVQHDAPTGFYHVTFTTPFSAPPTVTITVDSSNLTFGYAMTDGVVAGEFELLIRQDGGHYMNAPFHFIAVGPR